MKIAKELKVLFTVNKSTLIYYFWSIIVGCAAIIGLFSKNKDAYFIFLCLSFTIPVATSVCQIIFNSVKNRYFSFIVGVMLPFGLVISSLGVLKATPVSPYEASFPGAIEELGTEYLAMDFKRNTHFNKVSVTKAYITNRLDELTTILKSQGRMERFYNENREREENRKQLGRFSSQEALTKPVIAALSFLGKQPKFTTVTRAFVLHPIPGFLEDGDHIISINEKQVTYMNAAQLEQWQVAGQVNVKIERDGKIVESSYPFDTFYQNLVRGSVTIRSQVNLDEPLSLSIIKDDAVGDSSGLGKALEIVHQMGPIDLLKGRKIVVTGAIQPDGQVTSIGSIHLKYVAAIQNQYDVFIVPKENEMELRTFLSKSTLPLSNMKVYYVNSLKEAVRLLSES